MLEVNVPPLMAIRLGNGRTLPAGLGRRHDQPVYRFAPADIPCGAEFRRFRAEALTERERVIAADPDHHGDHSGARPLPFSFPPGGRPPVPQNSLAVTPILEWFCAEASGPLRFGKAIPGHCLFLDETSG